MGFAADLVNTGIVDHRIVVLEGGLALETRVERTAAGHAPVGADGALKAEFAAQHFRAQDVGVVDIQGVNIRAAVIAHRSEGVLGDTGPPRHVVVFLPAARIDEPAAGTVLVGTGAGPVLEVDQDFVRTDHAVLALGTIHKGLQHLGRQFGGLGEAAHVPAPAGLGHHVDLRAEDHMQTHGAVFLGDDSAEVLDEFRVTGGGDADLAFVARELGEILGAPYVGAGAGAVARVGREHDRNAQAGRLGDFLHAVGPFGELARRAGAVVQDVAEILLFDVGLGGSRAAHLSDGHGIGVLAARADRSGIAFFFRPGKQCFLLVGEVILDHAAFGDGDVGMEHQAGFFFEGHLADQVGDAVFNRKAPILIGIEGTVLVEVLELELSFSQDVGTAGAQFRLFQFRGAGRQQDSGESEEEYFFHMWLKWVIIAR